jgi:hypothetical protein
MDAQEFLTTYVDYAAQKLDTYEQAIYLYLIRHGPLLGQREVVFPIESSTKRLALGIAKKGAMISRDVVRKKLQSLEAKGFVRVLRTEYRGTRIECRLPEEVPGVIQTPAKNTPPSLEAMDFFTEPGNREAIFRREKHRCFYCSRTLTNNDRVLDHVVPRPQGGNSYKNLVASCVTCNNKKGHLAVEDFLRDLFRDRLLNEDELRHRLAALQQLAAGELKPVME